MRELTNFKLKLKIDKALQEKMGDASTIKDVVEIASSAGCHISEDEVRNELIETVSGTKKTDLFGEGLAEVDAVYDIDAFFSMLEDNEDVRQEFYAAESLDDIFKLAKDVGYDFFEEDLDAFYLQKVSGGGVSSAWKKCINESGANN